MEYQRATKSAQREQQKASSFLPRQTALNHVAVHPLLRLQQTIGNQAVQNMLPSGNGQIDPIIQAPIEPRFGHDYSQIPVHTMPGARLQTKLTVNQSGDVYEQEADQVSEQVMRMMDTEVALSDDKDKVKTSLMCKQSAEPETNVTTESHDVSPVVHDTLNSGGGQPLDATTREFMESRFGHDFSQVRVHTDEQAAGSAKAVNALAYTMGRNIVFGAGQYAPETSEGRRLIAHELTHVVQQDRNAISRVSSINPNTSIPTKGPITTGQQQGRVFLQRKGPPILETKHSVRSTTQALYNDAVNQLQSKNSDIYKILHQGRLNREVLLSFPQTSTHQFALTISPEKLPKGQSAEFEERRTSTKGSLTIHHLIIKIQRAGIDANDLAESLFHEGLHMLIKMDQYLPIGQQTGMLEELHTFQNRAKNLEVSSSKPYEMARFFLALEFREKTSRKPPFQLKEYERLAELTLDLVLHEKFDFTQVAKAFGHSRLSNEQIARLYLIDSVNRAQSTLELRAKIDPQRLSKNIENCIFLLNVLFDALDKPELPNP